MEGSVKYVDTPKSISSQNTSQSTIEGKFLPVFSVTPSVLHHLRCKMGEPGFLKKFNRKYETVVIRRTLLELNCASHFLFSMVGVKKTLSRGNKNPFVNSEFLKARSICKAYNSRGSSTSPFSYFKSINGLTIIIRCAISPAQNYQLWGKFTLIVTRNN